MRKIFPSSSPTSWLLSLSHGELIFQQFWKTLPGPYGQNLNKARVSVLVGKSDLWWKLLFSYGPVEVTSKPYSLGGNVKQLAMFRDEAAYVAARLYIYRTQHKPLWWHCHQGRSTGGWGQAGKLGLRFWKFCYWITLPSYILETAL